MKITEIISYPVAPRWLFTKIKTSEGIEGWGEPVVEGRADTVRACIDEIKDQLIGKNPMHVEDIWQMLYRGGFYRGGPILTSVLSGIDQALWDIMGKAYNLPSYAFFGGKVRDKMRVYCGIDGETNKAVADAATRAKQAGYTAVKMCAVPPTGFIDTFSKIDACVSKVQAVRERLGRDFDIAVDFHGRMHKAMAKVLIKELEPVRLLFIEEPVLIEHLETMKDLKQSSCTPIATGERAYTRWDFKRILESGAVDIIQPDLSHAGGLSETRRIAAMAEAYDVAVAPHCPLGPIALAACLCLDYTCINACIQEQSMQVHEPNGPCTDYMKKNPFDFQKGYIIRTDAPGLGIEADEEKIIEAAKIGHSWKNPIWRHEDGSIVEW